MPIIAGPNVVNLQKLTIPFPANQRLITYAGEVEYTHQGVSPGTFETVNIEFVVDRLPQDARIIEQTVHVALNDIRNNGSAINARWAVVDATGRIDQGVYLLACLSGVQDSDGYIERASFHATILVVADSWCGDAVPVNK